MDQSLWEVFRSVATEVPSERKEVEHYRMEFCDGHQVRPENRNHCS